MRRPAAFEALADRNLRRYLLSRLVSGFGAWMSQIALAFAVLEFGGPTDLGVVLLARERQTVRRLRIPDAECRKASTSSCERSRATRKRASSRG